MLKHFTKGHFFTPPPKTTANAHQQWSNLCHLWCAPVRHRGICSSRKVTLSLYFATVYGVLWVISRSMMPLSGIQETKTWQLLAERLWCSLAWLASQRIWFPSRWDVRICGHTEVGAGVDLSYTAFWHISFFLFNWKIICSKLLVFSSFHLVPNATCH